MKPQRHPKIIENLIWVPPEGQPGLQAPPRHRQKPPRPLPDLFLRAPRTLLDMFLHCFKQQKGIQKNNQNKEHVTNNKLR